MFTRHEKTNTNEHVLNSPKVGVVLFNHGKDDLKVDVGDRVAQLVVEKIATPEVVEVEDLQATARGAGGFGSTGVKADGVGDAEEAKEPEAKKQRTEAA